jgi:hypothetical protein
MRKLPYHRTPLAVVAVATLSVVCTGTTQAQVKLQYKFPEGQKLTYKTSASTAQILKLAGQAIETGEKKTILSSRTFGQKRADATQPITEKVESFATEISLPGGISVSYDSKDPNAKIDHPQLSFLGDVYKLVSNLDYTVVLDSQNKVKAVEGTEKILEKTEKLNDMAKEALRSALDAGHLKEEFEQSHGNLPDVLARTGEPWERTETLNIGGGQTLTFRKKYEYAGTEKKDDATLDKITVKTTEVKYAMAANSPSPLKVLKSDLKIASSDGVILFDREAGRVVSSKGKTQIIGPMTFETGGQEIPGELDLTLGHDTELQPAAK